MTDWSAVFAALLLFSDMRETKMRKNIRNIFLVALLLITGAVSCAFAESSAGRTLLREMTGLPISF